MRPETLSLDSAAFEKAGETFILRFFESLICISRLSLLAVPQLIGLRMPALGVFHALVAQVVHALRGLQIGGTGPGAVDHFPEQMGVFQHGAGTQMVLVKGLARDRP